MRIYVIDDVALVTKTIQNFLNDLGCDVFPFSSVSELLNNRSRENENVDTIIVDIKMPQEISVRKLRELHMRYPNTPIVVMSSILPYYEAISCGIYSYLKTPISFAELELTLTRISERSSLFNALFNKEIQINQAKDRIGSLA